MAKFEIEITHATDKEVHFVLHRAGHKETPRELLRKLTLAADFFEQIPEKRPVEGAPKDELALPLLPSSGLTENYKKQQIENAYRMPGIFLEPGDTVGKHQMLSVPKGEGKMVTVSSPAPGDDGKFRQMMRDGVPGFVLFSTKFDVQKWVDERNQESRKKFETLFHEPPTTLTRKILEDVAKQVTENFGLLTPPLLPIPSDEDETP